MSGAHGPRGRRSNDTIHVVRRRTQSTAVARFAPGPRGTARMTRAMPRAIQSWGRLRRAPKLARVTQATPRAVPGMVRPEGTQKPARMVLPG